MSALLCWGACLPGAAAAILASRCVTLGGTWDVCGVQGGVGKGKGKRDGSSKHTARPGIAEAQLLPPLVAFRLREAKNALGTPVCRRGQVQWVLLAMLRVNMALQEFTKYTDTEVRLAKLGKGTQEQATPPFVDTRPKPFPLLALPDRRQEANSHPLS